MQEYRVCFECLARLVRLSAKLAVVGAVVYAVAFLKLGELTFVQHVSRIAHTSEFSDLKAGLRETFARTHSAMVQDVRRSLAGTKFEAGEDVAAPKLNP